MPSDASAAELFPEALDAETADRAALIIISRLPRLGPRRGSALLATGRPADVLANLAKGHCSGADLDAKLLAQWAPIAREADLPGALEQCKRSGVAVSHDRDPTWPSRLADDPEPPFVLFHQGRLDALDRPTVAIVGTRRCSHYGRDVAYELGSTLASAGVAVVSGLALGIDAAAHAGSLTVAGSSPIGVVAGGHDYVYPPENRGLWGACIEHGLLLSERPPGSRPSRWGFPARNRIIAGLADVVVVVESREKGGSMYTVEEALRRNRPVLAVPGPIRSAASAGTNRLLADGAEPLCSPDDVLVALGLERPETPTKTVVRPLRENSGADGTGSSDDHVLDAIGWSGIGFDELVDRVAEPAAAVAVILERLIARGLATRTGGTIERRAAGVSR